MDLKSRQITAKMKGPGRHEFTLPLAIAAVVLLLAGACLPTVDPGGSRPAEFAPDAATALTATGADGAVDLAWAAPAAGEPVAEYKVYRGMASGVAIGGTPLATVAAPATTYQDTAVIKGTTYHYVLTASNFIGESPASGEAATAAATIFTGVEKQKIVPAGVLAGDGVGGYIAISGDTAVVGASLDDTNGSDAGAAYVYNRDPVTGVWSQDVKLLASDGVAGDGFGVTVAIDGD
ncbi:MAG: hypothetical protein V3S29_14630 [bacterium]